MQPMPCTQSTLREAACRKLTLAARGLSPFHVGFFVVQVQPPSKPPLKKVRQHRFPDLQNSTKKTEVFRELWWFFDDFLLSVMNLFIPSSELWWEWLKSASASFRPRSPLASTRYAAPDLSWSWPSTCHRTFNNHRTAKQKSSKIRLLSTFGLRGAN